MKLRDTFASKVVAAALVYSVAGAAPAFAQDQGGAEPAVSPTTTQIKTDQVKTGGELSRAWSVAPDPYLPIGVIGGLGAAYALFSLYAVRRKTEGAWMRAGIGSIIALALINPEIVQETRETLPTEVVVVVDKSSSQTLGDRAKVTEQVRERLSREIGAIGGVNIRYIEVDGKIAGAVQDGTNLFAAVQEGLSDVSRDRIGGIFMLTDGQVHDIPDKPESFVNGAPLHVLLSGKAGEVDRRIVIDQVPRFALINQEQSIKFRVLDDGVKVGSSGRVRVTLTSEGNVIGTRFVTPGQPVEMKVNIPRTGPNMIELKTDPLPGELTDVNNRMVASIEGIRETLNVLVISGAPNAGLRMWRDLFKADADSNLIHFTTMRSAAKLDDTPNEEFSLTPFPFDELFIDKINKFDLVVFDHFGNDGTMPDPYLKSVADYVKNGGSLLVVNGPDYAGEGSLYKSPLEPILPAAPSGQVTQIPYKPKLTEQGLRHPVTRGLSGADIKDPQWGSWFRIVDSNTPSGDIIMSGPNKEPLLILDHKDKGRVAMLMSDDAWLWAKGYDGGGPHTELLRRISHWLMKSPALEEEALHLSKQDDKIIVEQQTMANQSTSVTFRTPSGKIIPLKPEASVPGLWKNTVPISEFGLYSAEQTGKHPAKAFINVGPANPKEFSYTISTPEIMTPIVRAAGGKIARMENSSGEIKVPSVKARRTGENMAGEDEMGIRMTDVSVLKGVEHTSILPPWALMLLTMGFVAGAYFKEGDGKFFEKKKPSDSSPRNGGPQP